MKQNFSNARLFDAWQHAVELHKYQKYGEFGYEKHLSDVFLLVAEGYPDNVELQIAAILHDAVEDTSLSMQDLQLTYGDQVAAYVHAVTTKGGSRKNRNELLITKLKRTPAAIPIKLADRISNVKNCWATQNTLLFAYYREHRILRDALFELSKSDTVCLAWWEILDNLLGNKR